MMRLSKDLSRKLLVRCRPGHWWGLLLLLPFISYGQLRPVSGTVRNESGIPLEGVSVSVKSQPRGAMTDSLGRFRLSAAIGATLTFSSVNYDPQSVVIGEMTEYQV